jgi:DNA polymerase-3 subunit gamma/tau
MTETRIETYIPLYRKYRPQTFADLVGQEAIAQTLGNAIQLNKVAHAYLFCGPRGTGKTSTARIFAKSLNCEQGPTVTPCLQCASCTGITQGNALDVIEFDAASNNGVGDARELIENCQYSSMTGRFKVYIIDEVHMLTPQAFNALLKTLEEPPANVIFIFATTEAHKVLPTIISRCQRFDFNRITTENIVARLRYIAEQEQISIDEEALLAIGRHARGGLRDAVGLLDQVSVLSRAQQDKVIGRKDVALFIGTLEEELLLRLGNSIAQRQAADLLNDLNELLSRGIEPVQLLKDLTMHFRNLLLVKASAAQATPDQ